MEAYRLKEPVKITGLDYWGRMSRLTFAPHPEGKTGWWWRVGSTLFPVTMDIVETATRRIVLRVGGTRLHVWEHIGALRFTGLDSIVVDGSGWPPYDGGSGMYWEALSKAIIPAGYKLPWRSTGSAEFHYPKGNRLTQIVPAEGKITVKAMIDYQGVGRHEAEITLPHNLSDLMTDLIPSQSQGWPLCAYRPTKILSPLMQKLGCPFPRPDQMSWPQVLGQRAAVQYWRHRAWDVFGAMNLVFHDALPACEVTSICSGHFGDIEAIKRLPA